MKSEVLEMEKEILEIEKLIEPNLSGLTTIDVVCPKCNKKAIFKSIGTTSTYLVKPLPEGNITCGHCGLHKDYRLDNLKYFYHIEVGSRVLVARTKGNLIKLRDFFNSGLNNKEHHDSTIDFPKSFYLKREEIVRKIDKLLIDER